MIRIDVDGDDERVESELVGRGGEDGREVLRSPKKGESRSAFEGRARKDGGNREDEPERLPLP